MLNGADAIGRRVRVVKMQIDNVRFMLRYQVARQPEPAALLSVSLAVSCLLAAGAERPVRGERNDGQIRRC